MQRQQTRAASNTFPMWDSKAKKKPTTVVDRKRSKKQYLTETKNKAKLKEVKMISVFGMKDKGKSTSRAPAVYHEKKYSMQKVDQFVTQKLPKSAAFEQQMIDSEYGDGWNK